MNILSLLIKTRHEDAERAVLALEALPGVEVAERQGGVMVVLVEDTAQASAADTVIALHDVPGVMSVTLVYQYGDADIAVPG